MFDSKRQIYISFCLKTLSVLPCLHEVELWKVCRVSCVGSLVRHAFPGRSMHIVFTVGSCVA